MSCQNRRLGLASDLIAGLYTGLESDSEVT